MSNQESRIPLLESAFVAGMVQTPEQRVAEPFWPEMKVLTDNERGIVRRAIAKGVLTYSLVCQHCDNT